MRSGRSTASACSTIELVARALGDTEAGVRENALRLAEPRLAGSARAPGRRAGARRSSNRTRARSSSCWRRWAASTPPSRRPRRSSCSSRTSTTRGCRWRRCRPGPTAPRRTWRRRWRPTASRARGKSDGHAAFFTLAGSAVAATREPVRVASLIAAVARGGADRRVVAGGGARGRAPRACAAPAPACSRPAAPICSRWPRAPTPACDAPRWPCSASRSSATGPRRRLP